MSNAAQTTGLSGYLVVWSQTMDDVPVGLFDNKTAAEDFASNCSFDTGYEIARTLNFSCSSPVCFKIIQFENGRPVTVIPVNRADDSVRIVPPLRVRPPERRSSGRYTN